MGNAHGVESDRDPGREETAAELRVRLPRAGAEYLLASIGSPGFGAEHAEIALTNPSLPAAGIQRIASDPRWSSRYEILRGVVFHRSAPEPLAMNLLHHLRWRDLARAADEKTLSPVIRQAAVSQLRTRVAEMALGERIALARAASPSVLTLLREDRHPDVIAALLLNPRLSEEQVLALCARNRAPAPVLAAVAACGRWRDRYPVKLALLRNPGTPAASSLPLLESLLTPDLAEVAESGKLPRLVRATARQILGSRKGSVDTRKGGI
jgi:hypothetical protein